jgi:hypothetical protein
VRIKLAERWIDLLIKAPESGMGYQRVDVQFADGRRAENVMVFNAEDLDVPDTFAGADVQDLKLHGAEPSVRKSDA